MMDKIARRVQFSNQDYFTAICLYFRYSGINAEGITYTHEVTRLKFKSRKSNRVAL